MHYRNRRKIILGATTIAAVALSGCATTPRHTNLLIFGTNTTGGLEVGTNANQIPRILFGYTRQEVVLMPLLANTRLQTNSDGSSRLVPCGLEPSTTDKNQTTAQVVPEGCKFLGRAGGVAGDYDTYSVLASFGAGVQTEVRNNRAKADGKVAQYFATGLAARALAENGGAAVIATGNPQAAVGISGSDQAIALVEAQHDKAIADVARVRVLRAQVSGFMSGTTDPSALLGKMDKSISKSAVRSSFTDACGANPTAAACAKELLNSDSLDGLDLKDWQDAAAAAANN